LLQLGVQHVAQPITAEVVVKAGETVLVEE